MQHKTVRLVLFVLGMAALGGAFGWLIGHLDSVKELIPKGDINAWFFLYLVLSVYFVLLIHELGHLFAGLAQGFDFQLLVVGFLGIVRKEDGRIRPYLNKEWAYHGGVALSTPRAYTDQTARQFGRVLLAGPLSSLGFTGVVWGIMPWMSAPFTLICLMSGLMSFAIFLATTIPSRTGMFYTDRKRYQRLNQPGATREIELALIQAITLKMQQKSIREMELTALERITEDAAAMFKYSGLYYLYEYHQGDPAEQAAIRRRMEPLEAALPAGLVKQMQAEMEKFASSPA